MSASGGRADVEIGAAAAARELRFGDRPRVSVRADRIVSDRERLPRPVEPGVTYRRVRAAIEALRSLR